MRSVALLFFTGLAGLPALEPRDWRQAVGPPSGQHATIALGVSEWRFGSVWQGQVLTKPITLKNVGGAPLEIREVKSSCSCTAAKPERNKLGPGESTTFMVALDTSKRTGRINAVVTVRTNDPLNPRVQVAIRGEVKPVFRLEPSSAVTLGRIASTTRLTRSLDIRNLYIDPSPMSLEGAESLPWDVRLVEVKAGRHYRLEVSTRPPTLIGFLKGAVRIKTGLALVPELEVTINCLSQPPVTVTPQRIYVPPTMRRKTEQTVRVTYDSSLDFRITDVKVVGTDRISAELLPPPAKPAPGPILSRRIRVGLPPAAKMPNENAWLEIHTNHPEFEKLVVHFTPPPGRNVRRQNRQISPKVRESPEAVKKEPPGREP